MFHNMMAEESEIRRLYNLDLHDVGIHSQPVKNGEYRGTLLVGTCDDGCAKCDEKYSKLKERQLLTDMNRWPELKFVFMPKSGSQQSARETDSKDHLSSCSSDCDAASPSSKKSVGCREISETIDLGSVVRVKAFNPKLSCNKKRFFPRQRIVKHATDSSRTLTKSNFGMTSYGITSMIPSTFFPADRTAPSSKKTTTYSSQNCIFEPKGTFTVCEKDAQYEYDEERPQGLILCARIVPKTRKKCDASDTVVVENGKKMGEYNMSDHDIVYQFVPSRFLYDTDGSIQEKASFRLGVQNFGKIRYTGLDSLQRGSVMDRACGDKSDEPSKEDSVEDDYRTTVGERELLKKIKSKILEASGDQRSLESNVDLEKTNLNDYLRRLLNASYESMGVNTVELLDEVIKQIESCEKTTTKKPSNETIAELKKIKLWILRYYAREHTLVMPRITTLKNDSKIISWTILGSGGPDGMSVTNKTFLDYLTTPLTVFDSLSQSKIIGSGLENASKKKFIAFEQNDCGVLKTDTTYTSFDLSVSNLPYGKQSSFKKISTENQELWTSSIPALCVTSNIHDGVRNDFDMLLSNFNKTYANIRADSKKTDYAVGFYNVLYIIPTHGWKLTNKGGLNDFYSKLFNESSQKQQPVVVASGKNSGLSERSKTDGAREFRTGRKRNRDEANDSPVEDEDVIMVERKIEDDESDRIVERPSKIQKKDTTSMIEFEQNMISTMSKIMKEHASSLSSKIDFISERVSSLESHFAALVAPANVVKQTNSTENVNMIVETISSFDERLENLFKDRISEDVGNKMNALVDRVEELSKALVVAREAQDERSTEIISQIKTTAVNEPSFAIDSTLPNVSKLNDKIDSLITLCELLLTNQTAVPGLQEPKDRRESSEIELEHIEKFMETYLKSFGEKIDNIAEQNKKSNGDVVPALREATLAIKNSGLVLQHIWDRVTKDVANDDEEDSSAKQRH